MKKKKNKHWKRVEKISTKTEKAIKEKTFPQV